MKMVVEGVDESLVANVVYFFYRNQHGRERADIVLKAQKRFGTVEVVEDLLKENVEKGGQILIGGDGTGRLEGIARRCVRDLDCKETLLLEKVDDKVPVLTHEIEAYHFLYVVRVL
jgi:hypothetical protein